MGVGKMNWRKLIINGMSRKKRSNPKNINNNFLELNLRRIKINNERKKITKPLIENVKIIRPILIKSNTLKIKFFEDK